MAWPAIGSECVWQYTATYRFYATNVILVYILGINSHFTTTRSRVITSAHIQAHTMHDIVYARSVCNYLYRMDIPKLCKMHQRTHQLNQQHNFPLQMCWFYQNNHDNRPRLGCAPIDEHWMWESITKPEIKSHNPNVFRFIRALLMAAKNGTGSESSVWKKSAEFAARPTCKPVPS